MPRILVSTILVLGLLACDHSVQQNARGSSYFDLESILDQQFELLVSRDMKISKEVFIDGQSEVIEVIPDSSIWKSELLVFEPFDPGKDRYTNAFQVTEFEDKTIRYEKLPDENQSLRWVEVFQEEGDLRFRAEILEEASIYTTRKTVELVVEAGILKSYSLQGFQKMLLRDTAYFQLEATVF